VSVATILTKAACCCVEAVSQNKFDKGLAGVFVDTDGRMMACNGKVLFCAERAEIEAPDLASGMSQPCIGVPLMVKADVIKRAAKAMTKRMPMVALESIGEFDEVKRLNIWAEGDKEDVISDGVIVVNASPFASLFFDQAAKARAWAYIEANDLALGMRMMGKAMADSKSMGSLRVELYHDGIIIKGFVAEFNQRVWCQVVSFGQGIRRVG
jgi:hypothetical protein